MSRMCKREKGKGEKREDASIVFFAIGSLPSSLPASLTASGDTAMVLYVRAISF